MAGAFIRGALVKYVDAFLRPEPKVISFQFNPESITHTWTQAQQAQEEKDPLAVKGFPGESFSLNIAMDANDMITDGQPDAQDLANSSGIYSRLAALEMLLYPVGALDSDLLAPSAAANGGGGSSNSVPREVPKYQLPLVLFVWGGNRVVPVRVTGLTITERLYDTHLNPTHAEAQLTLTVITPEDISKISGSLKDIARSAYKHSLTFRQNRAEDDRVNADVSVIGLLPT